MKKLIITLIISSVVFISGQAQVTIAQLQKMPVDQKAALFADSLNVALKLSKDQYVKVKAALAEGFTKAQPVIKSNDYKFSKGMQLNDIFNAVDNKIKPVLTAKQQTLYNEKMKALKDYYSKQFQDSKIVFAAPASK